VYPAAIAWAIESSYPRVGDRLDGRYELRALVHDHGHAVSLTALDHASGREVSITALDPGRTHANAAFARCVAAVAGLRGLLVPRFVAAAAPRGPYIVHEPPPGASLAQLLALAGPLPWPRVLTIAERCLEVLLRAHAVTGTGHRALTPARCIVDAADSVVLTDYGWVELVGPDEMYRAPEQAGATGDDRSDVYTLAAIAFEAIAGKRPASVDALLTRALAEDPAQRPALAEMRGALRELLELPATVETATVETAPAPPVAREGKAPVDLPAPSRPPVAARAPRPAEESTLILPDEPADPLPRTLAGTENSPFRPASARSPSPRSRGSEDPLPPTLAGTEASPFRPTSTRSPTPRRRVSLDEALQRQALADPRPEPGPRPGEPTEVLTPPTRSPDDPVTLAFKSQRRSDSMPSASASAPLRGEAVPGAAGPPAPTTAPLPVIRATSTNGKTGKLPATKPANPIDARAAIRQFLASPAAHQWLLRLVVFNTICVLLLLLLHVLD
jgi:serine/threonine protein kinase